jgi:putative nucleotidyltransferase with HDIG domain
MTEKDLDNLKDRFSEYVRSFYLSDQKEQMNIALKEEHTFLVCKMIRSLAGRLSLGPDKAVLAETIGLFHDIGRFPQFARYKTFRDSISVNHGKLGAEILVKEGLLGGTDAEERRTIINAVKFHNAFAAPPMDNAEDFFFLRLIRDADKLDIWRIFLKFFEDGKSGMTSEIGLGLPDTPGYSERVLSSIHQKKTVSHVLLMNINDLKLLQLSWVFDLNFRPSFALLEENHYVEKFVSLLPGTDEILKASDLLRDYVYQKAKTVYGPLNGDTR